MDKTYNQQQISTEQYFTKAKTVSSGKHNVLCVQRTSRGITEAQTLPGQKMRRLVAGYGKPVMMRGMPALALRPGCKVGNTHNNMILDSDKCNLSLVT